MHLPTVTIALASALLAASPPDPKHPVRLERYGDPPAPAAAPRYSVPAIRDLTRQVNVNAAGLNILGDAANETSIAIDPTAPNRMVITWRQFDTITSNFRQAGYAYTLDGGRTWSAHTLNPGVFRTDPVIRSDADGVFYWNALNVNAASQYSCDIFKSRSAGRTWSAPIFALGGDKLWLAIDRTGGIGRGNIYQAWNTAGNPYFPATFNRSTDRASSWTVPQELPSRPVFGQIAIGPDGEVYIAGIPNSTATTQFLVTRSLNARDAAAAPVFSPAVAVDMGGSFRFGGATSPNPAGLTGQINLAADTTAGPRRGWIYLLASVDMAPTADPMDIVLARSADGGQTWSAPIRVNADIQQAGAWQWFGTMSIAPSGRLDVVWVDTRESLQPNLGRLYYRSSSDGGDTWSAEQVLGATWNSWLGWPSQNKIGDYYDMESDSLGACLAYAATYNGEQDVYYLRIGPEDCNRNGVPDGQDIGSGAEQDCNSNGIPDSCEYAAGTLVHPDFNGDNAITPADVASFVNAWVADLGAGTLITDVDRDHEVTPADIAAFVLAWYLALTGPCR